MAKLPEAYAKEKAQKALEKQERLAKKGAEKEEQRKLENTEEKINEHAQKNAKARIESEERIKNITKLKKENANKLEIVGESKEVKKKDVKKITVEDSQEFKQYTKTDTKRKVCVEVEKTDKDGNVVVQDKMHTVRLSEKEKKYLNEQNAFIKEYFFDEGVVPRYNKYICSCCGKPKKIEEFHKCWSFINIGRADIGGQFHKSYCKDCSKKLFNYHYLNTCEKDEQLAMERWCCDTNTYWDIEKYLEARKVLENNSSSGGIVNEYVAAIGRLRTGGLTYWDSPTIQDRENMNSEAIRRLLNSTYCPLDWDQEDIKAKNKICKLLRYDPFEKENQEDRKGMYRNLELMLDESMSEDFVKLQAAIEIVRSFQRIKELRNEEQKLKEAGESAKAIGELSSLRKQELEQITKFSKDHGFAEAYRTKKAKGAGTLTGCMNEMREKFYEDGLINYYNVKTCKEMEETARMSIEAIFSQIGLNDNEAWQMVSEQSKRIIAFEAEILDLKEKLRQKEIEIKTIQLTEKARKEGNLEVSYETIDTDSDNSDDAVNEFMEDIFQVEYEDVNYEEVGDEDVD
jgi:hypothetical protein